MDKFKDLPFPYMFDGAEGPPETMGGAYPAAFYPWDTRMMRPAAEDGPSDIRTPAAAPNFNAATNQASSGRMPSTGPAGEITGSGGTKHPARSIPVSGGTKRPARSARPSSGGTKHPARSVPVSGGTKHPARSNVTEATTQDVTEVDDEPEVAESIREQQGTQITVPKFVTSDYVGEGATVLVRQLVEPAVTCLLYTSPSPRDGATSRMPSSA